MQRNPVGRSFLPLLLSKLREKQFKSPIESVVNETTVDLLRNLLSLEDYLDVAEQLNQPPDIKNILEFILFVLRHHYFTNHGTNQDVNRRARQLMSKIMLKWSLLPRSLFLTGVIVPGDDDLIGGGASVLDFKGEHEGKVVALKLLHNTRNLVDFCRELLMWRSLQHKFVLPFMGVYEKEATSQFFLVTPHMPNGSLAQWRKRIGISVSEVEKRLLEVAWGIHYIHSEGVVHGDLCGTNILLDDEFHVQISDFGLTRHSRAAFVRSGALHSNFSAPELFGYNENDGSDSAESTARTQESDVYAFGCLYYEIYYDTIPFEGSSALQIVRAVCHGERPPRLEDPPLSDDMWELMNQCWAHKKHMRPVITDILKTIESWKVPSLDLSSTSSPAGDPTMPAPRLSPVRRIPSPIATHGGLREDGHRTSAIRDAVKWIIPWRSRHSSPPAATPTTPNFETLQSDSPMLSIESTSDIFPTASQQGSSISLSLGGSSDMVYFQRHSELSFLPVSASLQSISREISLSFQETSTDFLPAASLGRSLSSSNVYVQRAQHQSDDQSFLLVPGSPQSTDCDISNSPLLQPRDSPAAVPSPSSDGSSDNIYLQPAQQHSEDQSFPVRRTPQSLDSSPSVSSERSLLLSGSVDYAHLQQTRSNTDGEFLPPAANAQPPVVFQVETNGILPVDVLRDDPLLPQEPPPLPPPPVLPSLMALLKLQPSTSIGSNVNQFTVDLMCRLLALPDYGTIASELSDTSDIELLLDFILYLLDNNYLPTQCTPETNRKARRLMFKLLSQAPVTPKSLFLTGVTVELTQRNAIGMGGFGYVYKGQYKEEEVALKSLYKKSHRGKSLERDFCREALVWRSLSHPYILPLLGICEVESQLFLVSPFMKNGTLVKWRKNTQPSVSEIRSKMLQVAEGIRYIHSEGIVHGDLRGGNVLLDDSFHAQITDFGLTRHSDVTVSGSATALTLRFAAPELFGVCGKCGLHECTCFGADGPQKTKKTPQTDVYAFGCLYYQIYFNTVPFAAMNDYQIMWRVTNGECPERLLGMEDAEWGIVQRCWDPNPYTRPTIEHVVETIQSIMRA